MALLINDFVIAVRTIDEIEPNSVGIIQDITSDFEVFFIGKNVKKSVNENMLKFLDLALTGKPYLIKICNVCHILKKDPEEFDINQTDALGRKTTRPSCKKCRVAIDGVTMHPSERARMTLIKPKHLFICPICEKMSIVDVTASLVIDHDHNTGRARSWICDSCNTGLGRFKDDITILNRAINYLENFKALEDESLNQTNASKLFTLDFDRSQ